MTTTNQTEQPELDLKKIKGHEAAKRAAEIAIAGKHSILFRGPMGCGKTMLVLATIALASKATAADIRKRDDLIGDDRDTAAYLDNGMMFVASVQADADISARLLDRFPLVVELPRISAADLILPCPAEGSDVVRKRILATQARPEPTGTDKNAMHLLRDAAEQMNLTARAFENAMKVAATLARMDGKNTVSRIHVAEALSYLARFTEREAAK